MCLSYLGHLCLDLMTMPSGFAGYSWILLKPGPDPVLKPDIRIFIRILSRIQLKRANGSSYLALVQNPDPIRFGLYARACTWAVEPLAISWRLHKQWP